VRCRPTAVEGARVKNRPPRADEIAACRVWMDTELRLVAPRVVVCLGALAAQALIAKGFRLTRDRGRWFPGPRGTEAVATIHPSYVLRQRGDAREQAQALLREDLALAAERVR
ncbi:MAG: uracil-DNA glycosylase, partial [Armatimonadetes bacterium]|nr:uracil-DNA glycosylase [Armatimonadota bacterium]